MMKNIWTQLAIGMTCAALVGCGGSSSSNNTQPLHQPHKPDSNTYSRLQPLHQPRRRLPRPTTPTPDSNLYHCHLRTVLWNMMAGQGACINGSGLKMNIVKMADNSIRFVSETVKYANAKRLYG